MPSGGPPHATLVHDRLQGLIAAAAAEQQSYAAFPPLPAVPFTGINTGSAAAATLATMGPLPHPVAEVAATAAVTVTAAAAAVTTAAVVAPAVTGGAASSQLPDVTGGAAETTPQPFHGLDAPAAR